MKLRRTEKPGGGVGAVGLPGGDGVNCGALWGFGVLGLLGGDEDGGQTVVCG